MNKFLISIGKVSEYIIYCFFVFVIFIILSPKLPTKNLLLSYVVPTGSMSPTVLPGSVVFVKPSREKPSTQEIIAFINPYNSSEIVLHRVEKITKEGIVTKGDNNNISDKWVVPFKNVQGKLIFSVPYIGHVVAFLRKPIGFYILAFVPAIFLSINFLRDIKLGIGEEIQKVKQKRAQTKIITLILLFFSLGFRLAQSNVKTVYAAFSAQANFTGISISANLLTPSPSPTASPTPTQSPTPTVTPSPTSKPSSRCTNLDISVEGNGDHSINNVNVTCSTNTVVVQVNNVTIVNSIHYEFEYNSDEGHQGVLGTFFSHGSEVIKRELFMGNCSSNTCVANTNVKDKHLKLRFDK